MKLSEDLYAIRKQIHAHINELPDDWWQWADELVDDLTKAIAKARELETYPLYVSGPWPRMQSTYPSCYPPSHPFGFTQKQVYGYEQPFGSTSWSSETFPNDEDKKAYDVLSSSKILKSDWYEEDTLPLVDLGDESV